MPVALGVTVLTSDADTSATATRLEVARVAACDDVVRGNRRAECACPRAADDGPGIRSRGANVYDQVRVDPPGDAMTRGADRLVIGRAVTTATDPEKAAEDLTLEVAGALAVHSE
jgi:orotidine-5'-phosphate decarboxylase